MKRDTIGELIFWGATIFALLLYLISAPSGLPWTGVTQLALAWSGKIPILPNMEYPLWGYFIQVFDGKFIALSCVAMAISAGLLGAIFNRYLGWRFGVAVALIWTTLPSVWNRAIIGVHSTFLVFGIVLAIWLGNAVLLFFTRKVRKLLATRGNEAKKTTLEGAKEKTVRSKRNIIAGWSALGLAVIFAVVASTFHNYRIGEAASAYAKLILEEADKKKIVLSGICDDQMIWEAERLEPGSSKRFVVFRNDPEYLDVFAKNVREFWPNDTNLWVAAHIGGETFANLALKKYPDDLYLMTGKSTTLTKWERRWEAMKPYLDSGDRFIPIMRRAFAFEGNYLGNKLQKEADLKAAWNLYLRIYNEIDRGNSAALINLSEMLRRGYVTDNLTKERIEAGLKLLYRGGLEGGGDPRALVNYVTSCGPIMRDEKMIAEFRAQYEARMKELEAEQKKKGETATKFELPQELKTLVELSNDMVIFHDKGDITNAVRIARKILSNPDYRNYIPANAIMGVAMALEGNYVESEMFFRVAADDINKTPPVVLNDYADTLRHLGQYEKAERYARKAVALTTEKDWLFRLTLAQVLRDAKKNPKEVEALSNECLRCAPKAARAWLLEELKK